MTVATMFTVFGDQIMNGIRCEVLPWNNTRTVPIEPVDYVIVADMDIGGVEYEWAVTYPKTMSLEESKLLFEKDVLAARRCTMRRLRNAG